MFRITETESWKGFPRTGPAPGAVEPSVGHSCGGPLPSQEGYVQAAVQAAGAGHMSKDICP